VCELHCVEAAFPVILASRTAIRIYRQECGGGERDG
jgi:hypothetical protein